MPKSKKNRKTNKGSTNHKVKSSYRAIPWINVNDEDAHLVLQDPLYIALRHGVKNIASGLNGNDPADHNAILNRGGIRFAAIYSKEMSVSDPNFGGLAFPYQGKHYGCFWKELLHPETVKGGFWVIREFSERPSAEMFDDFSNSALLTVIPAFAGGMPEVFLPLIEYNQRLLGFDTSLDHQEFGK